MDGSKSLDDLLAELADVQERLLELPVDAFEERVELRERRDDLQAEAGRFAHDWDRDRPTEDLLAELEALRARLGQLDSRRMNVAAQQGGGTQAGGGGDGWGAVQLNLAVDAASGVGEVHARIGRIKAVLADRGVSDVPAVPVVDSKVVWGRVWRLLRLVGMVLLLAAGVWWFFVRPEPVVLPESASDVSWVRVGDADLAPGTVFSMTEFGSGLVAVGVDESAGAPMSAVWTSPDGNAWTRVTGDAAFADKSEWWLSVASWGSGLVAVGATSGDGYRVWTSTDGKTWVPVDYHEAVTVGFARQFMRSVASFGSGVVVAGAEEIDWPNGDLDAAVWYSPDPATGLSRVARNDEVFGGDGAQMINAVTSFTGGVVSVGADLRESDIDAAVWSSTDGTTWIRVPDNDGVFSGDGNQYMNAVASFAGGVVAVGADEHEPDVDAAVWYSTDGTTWIRVDDPAFGGAGGQEMYSVAAYGNGVVAVGSDTGRDGKTVAAVWYSPDGTTWMRAPRDQAGLTATSTMYTVISHGTQLIAGGSGAREGSQDAAIWVGTNASR